jgi:homoserine O-acetyltransferase/O-succinyltransferase
MDTQPETALRPDPIDETAGRLAEPSQALDPKSLVMRFGADTPLLTDAGVELAPFQIAYQTAGTLNAAGTNAV